MPNVILEAGILGIPAIASNVDGMKDILIHQENGLTFHPSDKEACAQQIFKALKMSDNQRSQLGQNLKALIASKYTADQEAILFHQLFSGNHEDTLIRTIGNP